MTDPHTRDSRGFGFVSMMTSDQAEAAREGLTGEEKYGRTLSIERARRSRPRMCLGFAFEAELLHRNANKSRHPHAR